MLFEHRFEVPAPLEAVVAFHSRAESLRAITPPFIPMQLLEVPLDLEPGAQMSFRFWLGPFPVRWRARIEELPEGSGFADTQTEGPWAYWRHEHRFEAAGPDGKSTAVIDRIEGRLGRHPLKAAAALQMWLGLPLLFAYRRWKTRRLLAASPA